jgi:hypothetical protein
MSDIVTLKGKIKDTLEAITQDDGTSKIVVVYNYPESKPSGYPYAYINYKGDTSGELNNVEDLVEYEFEINLIQEKIEDFKGREEAEETTEVRAYDVNQAFRANNKLDLSDVIRVRPISTIKSYTDGNTRIMLTFNLVVLTKEEVSI